MSVQYAYATVVEAVEMWQSAQDNCSSGHRPQGLINAIEWPSRLVLEMVPDQPNLLGTNSRPLGHIYRSRDPHASSVFFGPIWDLSTLAMLS